MTKTPQDNTTDPKVKPKAQSALFNNKVFILAAVAILAWVGYNSFLRKHPLEGEPAPLFAGTMLDGSAFDMAEHLGKRPILLDFWAVWCPPCREALPKIAEVAAAYADKGLVVCAVNYREEPDTVNGYLRSRGVQLPVLLDSDGHIADLYAVSAFPTLVFIDRSGTVKQVRVGGMSQDALAKALSQIL